MKKLVLFFALLISFASCKEEVIKKPKKFIEKDKMTDMLYDLSLLEAVKAQNIVYQKNYPTASNFLKKKYGIDSITFAENAKYYGTDLKEYKKMYEKVKERLDNDIRANNGGKLINANPEDGIVK
jgi:hypothetical protein